jgi:O-antigen/teichoic acid export membrane protein
MGKSTPFATQNALPPTSNILIFPTKQPMQTLSVNHKKILLSLLCSVAAYGLINGLLIPMPIWKYLVIELILTIGWKLTERELKKHD